jgi:hypothetical protein
MGRVFHRRTMKKPPQERILRAVGRPAKFAVVMATLDAIRPIETDSVAPLNNVTLGFVCGVAV